MLWIKGSGSDCNCQFLYNIELLNTRVVSNLMLACVAWRFWLGALSNKGGRGQRNCEETGAEATFFLAASPLVLARFARISQLRRSLLRPAQQNCHATQANLM